MKTQDKNFKNFILYIFFWKLLQKHYSYTNLFFFNLGYWNYYYKMLSRSNLRMPVKPFTFC